jgi:hypothetical protein
MASRAAKLALLVGDSSDEDQASLWRLV